MASIHDLVDQDDALTMVVTIGSLTKYDFVVLKNGSPADLSGATVLHLSCKETTDAADGATEEIFDKDILSDPNHDLPNGKIRIQFDPTDLTDGQDGRYSWDIRIVATNFTGNEPRPAQSIVILPRVRRTN